MKDPAFSVHLRWSQKASQRRQLLANHSSVVGGIKGLLLETLASTPFPHQLIGLTSGEGVSRTTEILHTPRTLVGATHAHQLSTAPALTLLFHKFILNVCLKNVPARLYLPAFPVRSLACQTRFRPERRAILGVFLGGGCHADSGSGTDRKSTRLNS